MLTDEYFTSLPPLRAVAPSPRGIALRMPSQRMCGGAKLDGWRKLRDFLSLKVAMVL